MVPSYHGTSTYLLMAKYNNYAGLGGNGLNKIAILDPNDRPKPDPVTGVTVMEQVLTIPGQTQTPNTTAVPQRGGRVVHQFGGRGSGHR